MLINFYFVFSFFLQWKSANDIVYNHPPPSKSKRALLRSSPLKRSSVSSLGDGSSPKKLLVGSCSASGGDGDGSSGSLSVSSFGELDALLNRAFQVCNQLPTTCARLSFSSAVLAPGRAFDEAAAKDELSMEAASIEMLRNSINHCRASLGIIKKQ